MNISKTVYYYGKGDFRLKEEKVKDPQVDEVQIKTLANGICMYEVSLYTGIEKSKEGSVIGHEGIGVVVKVGKNVKSVKEGDYVVCNNWRSIQNLKEEDVVKFNIKPEDPSLYIAEPVECVVNALRFYQIKPGDRVLLIGAGFMGLLNLEGICKYPVEEIVVMDIKEYNLKIAEKLGATEILNVKEDKEEKVKKLAENPFDIIVECAGVEETIEIATNLVKTGGKIVLFAWHHGYRKVNAGLWHTKGLTILNTSPLMGINLKKWENRKIAVRLLENGTFDLSPLITHKFPVEKIKEAMEISSKRPEGFIKSVILF